MNSRMNENKSKFRKWLGKRFKLIVYHGSNYDILRKYNFSRFKFILLNFAILVLLFVIFGLLVVFTPLKRHIPGFPDKQTHRLIVENAIRADSLYHELIIRDQYLGFLRDAIFNDIPIDEEFSLPITNLTREQIKKMNDPRVLRSDRSSNVPQTRMTGFQEKKPIPHLFPPIKGVVTSGFNPLINHYGTDIVATDEEIIKSVLSGTVIVSNFTVETGYTIVIQHPDNILSVYRHAKATLVDVGDYVRAGDAIAVYGDTGELSYGKHLHFELWKNGMPMNPEIYIDF